MHYEVNSEKGLAEANPLIRLVERMRISTRFPWPATP